MVNSARKESNLDHFYVRDPTMVIKVKSITPLIGDLRLIILDISNKPNKSKTTWKISPKTTSRTVIARIK